MEISMRSMLTAGVAAVTASAVVFAPPVTKESSPLPGVQRAAVTLSAMVQPLVQNPGAVANDATAAASPMMPAATSTAATASFTGNAIMNFYFAVEPWVEYGFELAAYAFQWIPIPYVGYIGGAIMLAYDTGEPIVQSLFQSAQYLVDGNWGAIPSTLVNGFIDAGIALVGGIIPLPPLPPFPGAAVTASSAAAATPTPLQRLVGDTVITVKKDLADTETTIRNVFVPKSLSKAESAAVAAAPDATAPTSSAPRTTKLRSTDTVAKSAVTTKSEQKATVGAAKAGPGAAKASGKLGSATHSAKGAK
jgi:hypothetical protein